MRVSKFRWVSVGLVTHLAQREWVGQESHEIGILSSPIIFPLSSKPSHHFLPVASLLIIVFSSFPFFLTYTPIITHFFLDRFFSCFFFFFCAFIFVISLLNYLFFSSFFFYYFQSYVSSLPLLNFFYATYCSFLFSSILDLFLSNFFFANRR